MKVEIEVTHPDKTGTPGLARENLAKILGWDAVRKIPRLTS